MDQQVVVVVVDVDVVVFNPLEDFLFPGACTTGPADMFAS